MVYTQDDVRWKITCGKTNDQQEMTALAYKCLQLKTPHKNNSTKTPGFKPRQLTFQMLYINFPLYINIYTSGYVNYSEHFNSEIVIQ